MVTNDVIKLLQQYLIIIRSEGIAVNSAFLFGSYARNQANPSSDIDVLIVLDNSIENDDITAGKLWRLTKRVNTRIEPFLIGADKFNAGIGSPLIQTIKKEGILIS